MTAQAAPTPNRELPPLLKLLLEMGPLVTFFLVNSFGDRLFGGAADQRIFWATGVFMAAVTLSLAITYALVRKLPVMPLVSTVMILVFGGLTLALNDELFIKLKPTIVNTLFGVTLLVAGLMGKNLLKIVLDSVFELSEEGWRVLTYRWAFFFFFLAIVNEVIWRTQSTDFWVAFKVWGIMPITIAFALAQAPLLMRHDISKAKADEGGR